MHALTSVNFAGTAVVIRPDPLAVFRLRAWARGYLWSICELDLHEAVDVLQAEAECDRLVSRIGSKRPVTLGRRRHGTRQPWRV